MITELTKLWTTRTFLIDHQTMQWLSECLARAILAVFGLFGLFKGYVSSTISLGMHIFGIYF